ncbi:MAG TPA: RecQ family ATP-dependent DNA helicase [Phycisphaerales bacterium]|nr:RecQ family ATP-dependent DNA helicase [Phycisphaerales bacterium]
MPPSTAVANSPYIDKVREVLARYWGFDALRPLQGESIAATLAGRDSLTVLPTGGGKSLCYQVPPLVTGRLTLVVSPLISLMQDQVAGLRLAGVPAAAMFGKMEIDEVNEVRHRVSSGEVKILFVAPERLFSPSFMSFVVKANPAHVAIDEAHCISQWGHDFRPEYRRLRELRDVLPGTTIGAYTATATPRVRDDIVEQLGLRDPAVLVGDFDRPNLTYRILPRVDVVKQTRDAIARHGPDNAAIVYCLSRKDTDALAESLKDKGINAAAYHAGMTPAARAKVSDDFKSERLSVVVATVAFGMGIDRGDVRIVIHAAMPKSVEGYQQETGRAGRDGLPAECLLLYSNADAVRLRGLIERSAQESEVPVSPEFIEAQRALIDQMQNLASGSRCRHKALCAYFGQEYASDDCGACDVCLKELEEVEGGHDIARKIVSCVARMNQMGYGRASSFGARHLVQVLRGSNAESVTQRGHHTLSTFGILREMREDRLNAFVNQLVDSGALSRSTGEFPTIELGPDAAAVMKSQVTARLVEPKEGLVAEGAGARRRRGASGGGGVDTRPLTRPESELFETLRALRRTLAEERRVPPYVIASDAVLEELCRVRPTSVAGLTGVRGIGRQKAQDLGQPVVAAIARFCTDNQLPANLTPTRDSSDDETPRITANATAVFPLFRRGAQIDEVMQKTGRARSTVTGYLCDFITTELPASIDAWVDRSAQNLILAASEQSNSNAIGPVRARLVEQGNDTIDYDQIRITLVHKKARA